MRSTRTTPATTAPIAAAAAVLTLLAVVAWPLAALFRATTLDDLFAVLRDDRDLHEAWFWAATEAGAASVVGLALGLVSAYCWTRLRYPGRTVLHSLAVAPLAVPMVVIALGVEALFAVGTPASDLVSAVGIDPAYLRSGTGAVILAQGLSATAIVAWFAGEAWASVDARTVEAARTLGASTFRAARTIVWPVVRPAATAAVGFTLLQSLLAYGAVAILAEGRETPEGLTIRLSLAGDGRTASVAVLTMAGALICGITSIRFLRLPHPEAVWRRTPQRPEGFGRVAVAISAVPAALVLSVVVALCFRAVNDGDRFSTAHFQSLVEGTRASEIRDAALGSARAVLPAAALTAVWGGLAGAAMGRTRGAGGAVRNTALLLPVALSPAALTYGWLTTDPQVDPRVILPLVQAVAAFPLVAVVVARLRAPAHPGAATAARTLGARRVRAWRVLRGRSYLISMAVGFAIAGSLAFGESSAAAVARVPGGTLPLRLIDLHREGMAGPAAALAAVVVLIGVVAFTLGDPVIARLGRARR